MVHSVELLLDDDTDAVVRDLWDSLARAGVPSQAGHRSPSNRPHVTMTVGAELPGEADVALAGLSDRLPLPFKLGAPLLFGHGRFTLARLVVPSDELLEMHTQIHRICLSYKSFESYPHAAPGHWTPHVTLARRLDPALVEQAMSVPGIGGEIVGRFVGMRHWDGDARVEHPVVHVR